METAKEKHPKENVWEYPRPPAIQPVKYRIQVMLNGKTIADSTDAYRILETTHPPCYYFPRKDVQMQYLSPSTRQTFCEFKGVCGYFHVQVGNREEKNSVWFYSAPPERYLAIKDYVCFYASKMDECYVDGEKVKPQPSDFYGGWINSWIIGDVKGPPGTEGW